MTLKYVIVRQSTAVFRQSVENVVNTRSCMKKINTVIYRETGLIYTYTSCVNYIYT